MYFGLTDTPPCIRMGDMKDYLVFEGNTFSPDAFETKYQNQTIYHFQK